MRCLMFSPYIGEFPPWIDKYLENTKHVELFDFKILNNKADFEKRVKEKLGIDVNLIPGTCKISDFRPALGVLYEDELKGYDFWGHTDLDVVYGDLRKFIRLDKIDIYSNDFKNMCGPFSLFRNTEKVNNLFRTHPQWKEIMANPVHQRFDEYGFTEVVMPLPTRDNKDFRIQRGNGQANDHVHHVVKIINGNLFVDGKEEMIYHFNTSKVWPVSI